jgi:enoyl-CoA hydratase/carnithine racemase
LREAGAVVSDAGRLVTEHPAKGITVLRIERPARRGALSAEILEALRSTFAAAGDGCLVVTGTGEIFSAGYDLSGIGDPVDPDRADATIAPESVAALDALRDCRVPVIAALNGPALGGGLELALGCDVRFAVPGAYLAAPAGRLGLVYAPGGLERILGGLPASLAAELFVLGRRIEATRAHALGVVTELAEPERLLATALGAAGEVLAQGPGAVRANARALRALRAGAGDDVRAELDAARHAGMRSAEFAEGVAAFRGRRAPRWT